MCWKPGYLKECLEQGPHSGYRAHCPPSTPTFVAVLGAGNREHLDDVLVEMCIQGLSCLRRHHPGNRVPCGKLATAPQVSTCSDVGFPSVTLTLGIYKIQWEGGCPPEHRVGRLAHSQDLGLSMLLESAEQGVHMVCCYRLLARVLMWFHHYENSAFIFEMEGALLSKVQPARSRHMLPALTSHARRERLCFWGSWLLLPVL
jgi:hypothetical protein